MMKKLGKLFAAALAAVLAAVCLFTACDGGQEQGGDETPATVSAIEITAPRATASSTWAKQ